MEYESKVKAGIVAEQAKTGGDVCYANHARPSDGDIPAELEIDDTVELKDIDKDLSSLKSLCFRGSQEIWGPPLGYWNSEGKKKGDSPKDVLLEILPQCTSLQELHLNGKRWRADLSSGYINKILEVAPHLATTLKVLSFPLIEIDPDGVNRIVKFQNLVHIVM